MTRPLRLEFENAFYHVYSRGNRKELIYRESSDFRLFETLLLEEAVRSQVKVYAWCLMPNHFHMLIQTPRANLSLFMQRLLTTYAQFFNRKHNLVGHVFQSRYKSQLCQKEQYFLTLIRYIHLNPINTKKRLLVKNLKDWPWSSHKYYLTGRGPIAIENEIHEALSMIGERDTKMAKTQNTYEFFLGFPKTSEKSSCLDVERKRILGDDQFIDNFKKKLNIEIESTNSAFIKVDSAELLVQISGKIFGLTYEDLCNSDKSRKLTRFRHAIFFIGREIYKFPSKELGQCLGRDSSCVSHVLGRNRLKVTTSVEVLRLTKALKCQMSAPAPI